MIPRSLALASLVAATLLAAGCTAETVKKTEAPAEGAPTSAEGGGDAPTDEGATDAYPEGPYGKSVGQVLGDIELVGYLRNETSGLATSAERRAIKLSEIRAQAGDAKYAFIHVSAFWCGICRSAVEDIVAEHPKLASKAIFVDLLVEGRTPDDVATAANLDAWIKGLEIPFTVARDPDGVDFRIREEIGKNKTALLLDLETMKILKKSASDYQAVLADLEARP
jgi:hypothetical protein